MRGGVLARLHAAGVLEGPLDFAVEDGAAVDLPRVAPGL